MSNRTDVPYIDHELAVLNTEWSSWGAPVGNRNARKHGYYSKYVAVSWRQTLRSAGFEGLDLEIAFALWQLVWLNGPASAGETLKNAALKRFFALVRKKYGIRPRDEETLFAVLPLLCFELVFRPALAARLNAVQAAR